MTILIEYIIVTLGLLAGSFGPIFLNMFVLKIDISKLQNSWPLLAFMIYFMVVGGPVALNYYRRFRGQARLKIWPLMKWQAVGMFAGAFLLALLQSAHIFNDYVALGLVALVPGVFTVWAVRKREQKKLEK